MSDYIYCYPNSNVLKNKLGIKNEKKLHTVERKFTMLRIMELLERPIIGQFDLAHLKRIHWYIFQDIYTWAGEIRQVDIAKGATFCYAAFINEQSEELFEKLKKERYLAGMQEEEFLERLAYYFSEINALHPFREGNGRCQREFIRTLAMFSGHVVNFANVSKEEMLKASKESFLGDYDFMKIILKKCIRKRDDVL